MTPESFVLASGAVTLAMLLFKAITVVARRRGDR